tara:strand:- start:3514 stop:3732 length:219 start_codon:yes stop_codon:yes gene_type:complete
MDKIKGFIMEEEQKASTELDGLVVDMMLIFRLKGQSQPYCFDITKDEALRNLILSNLGDEYEEQETKTNEEN